MLFRSRKAASTPLWQKHKHCNNVDDDNDERAHLLGYVGRLSYTSWRGAAGPTKEGIYDVYELYIMSFADRLAFDCPDCVQQLHLSILCPKKPAKNKDQDKMAGQAELKPETC